MRNLSASKKAQSKDIMTVIYVLATLAIVFIFSYLIYAAFMDGFKQTSVYQPGQMDKVINGYNRAFNLLDGILFLIAVVLIIGIGIASYKLATAPVAFIISFLMAAFYGFLSYVANILFVGIFGQEALQTTLVHFPMTMLLCVNFHWIALVSLIVGSITLFAKKEKGQYV